MHIFCRKNPISPQIPTASVEEKLTEKASRKKVERRTTQDGDLRKLPAALMAPKSWVRLLQPGSGNPKPESGDKT